MYSVGHPATPTGGQLSPLADLNHTARQTAKKALAYRDSHLTLTSSQRQFELHRPFYSVGLPVGADGLR